MEPQRALDRVTRAVVAAFPDRAEAMLDAVERAFRMNGPVSPGALACAMCGRGQIAWFPLIAPDPETAPALRPLAIDERVLWQRAPLVDATPAKPACLDCLITARAELSPDPPSAHADRVLLDALRAVRAAGGDEEESAARELEAAFAGMRAPRIERTHLPACAICGQTRRAARGPAGAALCEPCSAAHWRAIATDSLTGVETRTIFAARMHFAIDRARRLGRPLALLLLDVDQLKSFNDIHGVLVGDALLTRIPGALRPSLSERDSRCRYGGEEFAVLLPERTVSEAVRIAEEIRARAAAMLRPPDLDVLDVERTRMDLSGRPHFPEGRVTVSIGVAGLQPDADALDLVRAADERVMDAKNTGRNRVCA